MLGAVAEFVSAAAERPFVTLGIVQTAALMAATLLLLYPVYAYGQNVAYTEGLVGLAVGLTLVTAANLLAFVSESTVRSAVPGVSLHPTVWMAAINLVAGLSGTVGVYFFAREFLPDRGAETDRQRFDDEAPDTAGGFETAGEDASEEDDAR